MTLWQKFWDWINSKDSFKDKSSPKAYKKRKKKSFSKKLKAAKKWAADYSVLPKDLKKQARMIVKCDNCNRRINVIIGFHCGYCDGWHCSKHKLPEMHKCKGNPVSPPKTKGKPIIYYANIL